jgi:hypothetical protein
VEREAVERGAERTLERHRSRTATLVQIDRMVTDPMSDDAVASFPRRARARRRVCSARSGSVTRQGAHRREPWSGAGSLGPANGARAARSSSTRLAAGALAVALASDAGTAPAARGDSSSSIASPPWHIAPRQPGAPCVSPSRSGRRSQRARPTAHRVPPRRCPLRERGPEREGIRRTRAVSHSTETSSPCSRRTA